MKGLIWKELRENRVLAILAVAVFAVLLVVTVKNAAITADRQLLDQGNPIGRIQPIVSDSFRDYLCIFCAVFSAALGWMQVYRERNRDLRAFIIHRPIHPAKVFWAKVTAGMILYVSAAGVPLLGLIFWVQVPGHVAAPFESGMVLLAVAILFSGIVSYFSAMLIGLRQASWAGSRILPAGTAALSFIASLEAPTFASASLIILVAGVVVIIAARGTFCTNGVYSGQGGLAKACLVTSLTAGAFMICIFVAGVVSNAIRRDDVRSYSYYSVGVDGIIYKTILQRGKKTETLTLDGKPAVNAKTKDELRPGELPNFLSSTFPLRVTADNSNQRVSHGFSDVRHFMTFWKTENGVMWYYWNKVDRLVGFDVKSRQFVGSLGPDGFSRDAEGKDRFLPPCDLWNGYIPKPLQTKNNTFLADLRNHTVRPLLPLGQSDRVFDATLIAAANDQPKYVAVATERAISLHSTEGKLLWELPYNFERTDYDQVHLAVLDIPGVFSVSPKPTQRALEKTAGKLPTVFMQVGVEKGIVKKETVPSIYIENSNEMPLIHKWLLATGSPLFLMGLGLLFPLTMQCLPFSFAYGGICVIAGLVINQRFAITMRSRLCWAVFHLLMGLPGFIAYIFARDWPRREKCSTCGKPRCVEHEHCEHCHAPFPAPERNGVEIFEAAITE